MKKMQKDENKNIDGATSPEGGPTPMHTYMEDHFDGATSHEGGRTPVGDGKKNDSIMACER